MSRRLTSRARARIAFALWVLVSGYVWVAYPTVMAALLLGLLVFAMLVLSIAAMMRLARRVAMQPLTLAKKTNRLHHWN
jgi:hypothetical protein